jgi:pimeloyl-ACP methyl ester carboxylesterase
LVLIHGGQLDHRIWLGQIGAFAAEYHVIAYDVRGFGQSSPKDLPHQAHRDLLALLDQLEVREKVHLCGLSLGGRIAVDFALTYPDRVRSLVLAGPGLSGWDWRPTDWDTPIPVMRSLLDEAHARRAVADVWLGSPYMVPAMEHPELRSALRRWAMDNARDLLRDEPDTDAPLFKPAFGRVSEITAPTLVLVGSRDIADIQEIGKYLEREIAGCRLVGVERVGHMICLEDPARFNGEVLTFLRSLRGK